jgi:hypothetical protein
MAFSLGGEFLLWCRHTGQTVWLAYSGPGGATTITAGAPGADAYYHLELPAGAYTFTAAASNEVPVSIDWDLVLANGLGQVPAESPQLVALASTGSTGVSIALAPTGPGAQASPPGEQAPAPAPLPSVVVPPSWASLISDRPLVGRPGLDTEHVAAVGPTTPGGSSPVASLQNGLPPGIAQGRLQPVPETGPDAEPVNGAMSAETDLDRREADQEALTAAENAERVMGLMPGRLQGLALAVGELTNEPTDAIPALPSPAALEQAAVVGGDGLSNLQSTAWFLSLAAVAAGYRLRSRRKARAADHPLQPPRSETVPERGRGLPRWQRNSMLSPDHRVTPGTPSTGPSIVRRAVARSCGK